MPDTWENNQKFIQSQLEGLTKGIEGVGKLMIEFQKETADHYRWMKEHEKSHAQHCHEHDVVDKRLDAHSKAIRGIDITMSESKGLLKVVSYAAGIGAIISTAISMLVKIL